MNKTTLVYSKIVNIYSPCVIIEKEWVRTDHDAVKDESCYRI